MMALTQANRFTLRSSISVSVYVAKLFIVEMCMMSLPIHERMEKAVATLSLQVETQRGLLGPGASRTI